MCHHRKSNLVSLYPWPPLLLTNHHPQYPFPLVITIVFFVSMRLCLFVCVFCLFLAFSFIWVKFHIWVKLYISWIFLSNLFVLASLFLRCNPDSILSFLLAEYYSIRYPTTSKVKAPGLMQACLWWQPSGDRADRGSLGWGLAWFSGSLSSVCCAGHHSSPSTAGSCCWVAFGLFQWSPGPVGDDSFTLCNCVWHRCRCREIDLLG